MGIVHTVVTVAEPRRGTEGERSKSHEDAVSPCQRSIAKMRLSVWPGGWRRARGRSPSPAWPPGRAGSKSRKTSMLPDRFAGGGDAGPLPSTLSISELSSGPYESPPGGARAWFRARYGQKKRQVSHCRIFMQLQLQGMHSFVLSPEL